MQFATSLFIAFGLAMDACAVCIGAGTSGQVTDLRSRLRLAWHFGIFQTGMTLLGWLAGATIQHWISAFDHWVAFGLLALVGINMIRSGLGEQKEDKTHNPSKGATLVMLSIATSIDALAVGLSLAMISDSIIMPSVIIGIVAFGMSSVGLIAGNKLGERFGSRIEILGGLILIGIGLQILVQHIF
jgi:putative Mn2+ efflux pump MntP